MANKHFKVEGHFTTYVSKIVVAKSVAEAKRKVRDSAVENRKLKAKDFDKINCQVFEID